MEANFGIANFEIQTNSKINFKQVQIEDLTNENCLLLDMQDEDVFNDVSKAIVARVKEVINENFVEQGLEPILEEKRPDIEINTTTVDNTPSTPVDQEELKENVKNKIITYISQAMTVAQNEGKTYTLQDLMNLDIPNTTFSVSIDGDVATLNVDGFEFKLNSVFQLYE